jgi:hypothetical protein
MTQTYTKLQIGKSCVKLPRLPLKCSVLLYLTLTLVDLCKRCISFVTRVEYDSSKLYIDLHLRAHLNILC